MKYPTRADDVQSGTAKFVAIAVPRFSQNQGGDIPSVPSSGVVEIKLGIGAVGDDAYKLPDAGIHCLKRD